MTKRKANIAAGVYRHLDTSGVLDTGDSAAIAECRKLYWREYKRKWKQEKRKNETEFKIYLTDTELQVVTKSAKDHCLSRTKYIKQAMLAYANRAYIVPDQTATNHITQLLSLCHASLQEIAETMPDNVTDALLQQIARLEQQVVVALCNPPMLTSYTGLL